MKLKHVTVRESQLGHQRIPQNFDVYGVGITQIGLENLEGMSHLEMLVVGGFAIPVQRSPGYVTPKHSGIVQPKNRTDCPIGFQN